MRTTEITFKTHILEITEIAEIAEMTEIAAVQLILVRLMSSKLLLTMVQPI